MERQVAHHDRLVQPLSGIHRCIYLSDKVLIVSRNPSYASLMAIYWYISVNLDNRAEVQPSEFTPHSSKNVDLRHFSNTVSRSQSSILPHAAYRARAQDATNIVRPKSSTYLHLLRTASMRFSTTISPPVMCLHSSTIYHSLGALSDHLWSLFGKDLTNIAPIETSP